MANANQPASSGRGGLSRLPIASKLLLLSGVYVAIIAGLQVLAHFSLEFQSSVRAFVGGEGLWSKAQKDAVHHLLAYTVLQREEDFTRYQAAMAVPLGDRRARQALSRSEPDLDAAYAGFIAGRNHPEDVRGMSNLFLRFGWWGYMAEALDIWSRADGEIDELVRLADQVRGEISAGGPSRDRQVELVAEIDRLNRRFTALEDDFSFTLGKAARRSGTLVRYAMLAMTLLALAAGLWLSLRISREIGGGVLRLRDGARRVAAGDFSRRIDASAGDEIGELARGFNRMTDSLVLHIGELERKEQALEEMDRLKTQFFANVSHELRTPLTLILGPAGKLASNAALAGDVRRAADVIERNSQLLLKHVNDLLDLSRLDAGRLSVEYARADLARIVRLVASHFDVLASDRAIRLEVDAPRALPVELDGAKIERVLLNLLSNAFKFSENGGRVRIGCRSVEEEAEIAVEDAGPGIAPELSGVIFERFRQVDGEATRRHGGTGLGLAIVREFVELHGGRIFVGSSRFGGASFVVRIPLRAPTDATVRDTAFSGDAESIAGLARQVLAEQDDRSARPILADGPPGASAIRAADEKPLVLVVEDSTDMSAFLAEVLGENYRLAHAHDGARGLALALELEPDLILTDVMMPVMSGEQFLQAVRSESALDRTPVVVLTAKVDEALRVRLLREGAQDFVVKPFSPAELVTRVDNLIAIKRAHDSIAGRLDERSRAADELARAVADQRRELVQGFDKLHSSESQLRVALAEKEVLMREIHHRVKNNLQVVASLLNLHSAEATERGSVEVLRRCADRVRAMSLLHQVLYDRKDFAHVDLGSYLVGIAENVRSSYASLGGVELRVESQEVLVDSETALPCGLILHELVVNAFRHAFPGGAGTVRVSIARGESGAPKLSVEDDGRGLPAGLDIERSDSLGLQLVTALAAQVGARVEVVRDHGTAFRVELAA